RDRRAPAAAVGADPRRVPAARRARVRSATGAVRRAPGRAGRCYCGGMRSLAAFAALAALVTGARADRADPLARELDEWGGSDWRPALVRMCTSPSADALRWCTAPAEGKPAEPKPAPPPPPPGTVAIASKQAHDPSNLSANQVAAKISSAYLGGVLR